jgi:hypothetical protein
VGIFRLGDVVGEERCGSKSQQVHRALGTMVRAKKAKEEKRGMPEESAIWTLLRKRI